MNAGLSVGAPPANRLTEVMANRNMQLIAALRRDLGVSLEELIAAALAGHPEVGEYGDFEEAVRVEQADRGLRDTSQ